MKVRVLSCLFGALLVCTRGAFAQQGTTEIRGKVLDAPGAAVPGATVVVRNQDTGMFRETVSAADGTYFVGGIVPGMYEVTAELQGFKKLGCKDIRLEIGKTTTLDLQLAVGGLEETVTRLGRFAAGRRHHQGSRRQHHRPRAGRSAVDQPQLHRLHRPAPGHRAEHQHRVVRLGLDLGQRRRSAQQQLHARRRQQQRRRHRPAGRDAGADRDRIGAGVPGHHQPVRRAVRPHDRRDHQRRDQERHQRLPRQRVRVRPGRRLDGEGLFREGAQPEQAGHAAARVRRHARRADRQGPGALLRQPRARDDRSRRGAGLPEPARSELEPDDAGPRVEHDGEVRSAAQRRADLEPALPARAVAAAQPGHRPGRRPARSAKRTTRIRPSSARCRRCSATAS